MNHRPVKPDQDHKLARFYVPARWPHIATITTGLGQALTDAVRAVARENPKLSGVINITDFNATAAGQRIVDDGRLAALVPVLNNPNYRLGLEDVEPDILGRACEYLLRKFAEGQGQSAGEFYTPLEVGIVMVLNRRKRHPGKILLINASKLFAKGRPKNYPEDTHIEQIAQVYHEWQVQEGLAAIVTQSEAARKDYDLSPSRYVSTGAEAEVLLLDEAVVLLAEAEEERAEADRQLDEVLTKLGFAGRRGG